MNGIKVFIQQKPNEITIIKNKIVDTSQDFNKVKHVIMEFETRSEAINFCLNLSRYLGGKEIRLTFPASSDKSPKNLIGNYLTYKAK